jgi:copper chaperone CopZ
MNKITVKIDGMMCGMCESHICDAIRQSFKVKKVTASHTKGEAVILTEDNITEQQLLDVIKPTGYEVKSVTTEPYEKKGLFSFSKK